MRRILAAAILSLLLCGSLQTQQVITARRRASTPAGTAPTYIGSLQGNTGSTNVVTCCISILTGSSLYVVMTGTAGGTFTVFDNISGGADVDTLTSISSHTDSANETHLFYIASPTTNSANTGIHCHNTSATDFIGCVALGVTCSSPCTTENLPSYTDTSGTGGSLLFTSGSITTAHQKNELLLGGCTQNGATGLNAGTITAGTGYTRAASDIVANGFANISERQSVSAVGSYTATLTESTSVRSSCYVFSVY